MKNDVCSASFKPLRPKALTTRRSVMAVIVVFVLTMSGMVQRGGIVAILGAFDATLICSRIEGLSTRQQILCRSYPDVVAAAGDGMKMATIECQFQFRFQRWNCSSNDGVRTNRISPIPGTREASFVQAIRSAGVAYSVTRSCSQGQVTGCRCAHHQRSATKSGDVTSGNAIGDDAIGRLSKSRPIRITSGYDDGERLGNTVKGSWRWGGCGANVGFGTRFSKAFLDTTKTEGNKTLNLVNLHNNRAGRKVLEDNTLVTCRCHGTSGSCTVRTCWTALPAFRILGDRLSTAYDRARRVEPVGGGGGSKISLKIYRKSFPPTISEDGNPSTKHLVYVARSPDYCDSDTKIGIYGTSGRTCGMRAVSLPWRLHDDVTATARHTHVTHVTRSAASFPETADNFHENNAVVAVDHCQTMCCGRGFESRQEVAVHRCRCQFRWCCYVACDSCTNIREELVCR